MLIRSTVVTFPSLGELQILPDQLLEISSTGYITHSSPFLDATSQALLSSPTSSKNIIEVPQGSFLLPTFTDLHLHAPQFLYQGTGLHLPLMQWLDEYAFRAEERIDGDATLARKVYEALAKRLVRSGTGAVCLFGTIGTEKTMQRAGVRAFVGKLSMDIDIASRPTYVEASAEAALYAARDFVGRCRALTSHLPEHRKLVHPVLTPRFVPTCSDELLSGLGELVRKDEEGLRAQSHLAEARDQVDWVRRTRGAEDIEVFDRVRIVLFHLPSFTYPPIPLPATTDASQQHGLLTPHTIQAHCTFLTPPELARLAERGTAIAHCPLSNAYFSSRAFPLSEALAEHVKVGLGTDIAGGYSADVGSAMRWGVGVAHMRKGFLSEEAVGSRDGEGQVTKEEGGVLDWKSALYLATRGGADALGLGEGAGTFAVGATFDAQQIRLFDPATLTGVGGIDLFDLERESEVTEEMVEKWWCVGDDRNRVGMWVQGANIWAHGSDLGE
ncbi:hypothetical protein DXG01_001409 [Tephrocybe rancida]|nr:hypothetical protein DXG01_001409 [Tephrocybe rancida]